VELVVSGRIAATLPLPAAPSDFRAAIAEKSLVNAAALRFGAGPLAAELDAEVALPEELELELELDELPHPATPKAATTSVGTIARFQPVMKKLLSTKARWAPSGFCLAPIPPARCLRLTVAYRGGPVQRY
jgi:hypothetical protein